jgi:DNA helicase HerA-like ATPase
MEHGGRLGIVVRGSLADGLQARLDGPSSVEDMRVGKFVKVRGEKHDFFCLVTDVLLSAANDQVLADPPPESEPFLRQVLAGTMTFGLVQVQPMLMLARDGALADGPTGRDGTALDSAEGGPRPVRTIPTHFSTVFVADEGDFERVFGAPGEDRFELGTPRDMDVPIRLNLKRFVERSNGVFGKSGTGKSFLTRLILCGAIRSRVAANLVFDMHSEYGWEIQTEDGHFVKGLKQLFQGQVFVYTLDPHSARNRSVRPDGEITIGYDEIDVDDIALLSDELVLNPTAVESGSLAAQALGREWMRRLMEMDGDALRAFCEQSGANDASLSALRRKLISHLKPLPFLREHAEGRALDEVIARLKDGKHVVLEFGQHRRLLPYMLVANIITRKLHGLWINMMERYQQSQDPKDRPPQLMITLEEAHRFLNPSAAKQTSFGTIAREMRKFNVTLLVIDQRPSGIDSEVMSQLGTRITAQLNDDHDLDAIFTGVSGATKLRHTLASLDSREEAMILGHAVPMPVVFQARKYDEAFYAALNPFGAQRDAVTNGAPHLRLVEAPAHDPREVTERDYETLFPE